MMISVDGYFEGQNNDISWHNVDAEFNEFAIKQLNEADLLLFGRKTYELMASYWPTVEAKDDDPIVAKLMNQMQKVVVSKTLKKVIWENTKLVSELGVEIKRFKEVPGKDILVFGSSNLGISLIENDLLDEVRIMVGPVVLAGGRKLLEGVSGKMNLKLVGTHFFKSGNALLRYTVGS